jgi:hypothetical protein
MKMEKIYIIYLLPIEFRAHVFAECLFVSCLPAHLAGAPALYPDEKHPDAKGDPKVWERVLGVKSAE